MIAKLLFVQDGEKEIEGIWQDNHFVFNTPLTSEELTRFVIGWIPTDSGHGWLVIDTNGHVMGIQQNEP